MHRIASIRHATTPSTILQGIDVEIDIGAVLDGLEPEHNG